MSRVAIANGEITNKRIKKNCDEQFIVAEDSTETEGTLGYVE